MHPRSLPLAVMAVVNRTVSWLRSHPLVADSLLAAVFVVSGVVIGLVATVDPSEREIGPLGWILLVGNTAPIAFRRIYPVVSAWTVLGANMPYWVLDYPGAVDVVLCTHLHFDHVGWNLRTVDGERVPTFPNARYLFSETEVDHTRIEDHHAVIEPSVQPLIDAGLADLVADDHVIDDAVRLLPTPGHTPGHVSLSIDSHGERAVITGDMSHTPLQFAEPELSSANFDHDADAAIATRKRMLDAWTDEPVLVLGTHFAPPTGGRIVTDGERVRFRSD